MPIITLKIGIEKEIDGECFKHFLNHEDFDVYSTQEDRNLFNLYAKKLNKKPVKECQHELADNCTGRVCKKCNKVLNV